MSTLGGFNISKPGAPTVAAGASSGSLDTSAIYRYRVTFLTAFGETAAGTEGSVTTSATGSVELTDIPTSTNDNVTSRRIYRSLGGGTELKLLATLEDNLTTTYTDLMADVDLGESLTSVVNTAHSLQTIHGNLKMGLPVIASYQIGVAAAGSAAGDATQLDDVEYVVVETVALNAGVALPGVTATHVGKHVKIANQGANPLDVYAVGGTIDGAAINTPKVLAAGESADFIATGADAWHAL